MKYAKLINGSLRCAGNPILADGCWKGNPPDAVYASLGFKPVIFAKPPEAEPGFHAVESWTETAEAIMQDWSLEPEGELEDGEALNILLGGD